MIRPLASLVHQSLRAALRSRLVAALLALLALVVLVLPRTVRGDGTHEGDLRMLLTWTLGCAVLLLATATLWAGCQALAGEARDGTLGGLAVTPVRRPVLLLGKWLGLVILDGALLAATLAGVAVQVVQRGIPLERLRPHRALAVAEESLREHARAVLARARTEGRIPVGVAEASLLEQVREELRGAQLAVAPGEAHLWRFRLPARALRPGEPARVRVVFSTPIGTAGEVSAACRVLDAAGEEVAAAEIGPEHRRQFEFAIPADRIGATPTLTLLLENMADEDGMALLVGAEDGALLYVPQGSVGGNLLAAGVVLWSVLAALAALGLAAGALFSLPVAVFVASCLAAIALVSHAGLGCASERGEGAANVVATGMARIERISAATLRYVALLTRAAGAAAPLDRLGERLLVTPAEACRAAAAVGLLLPLLAGCVAVPVLRLREFP